MNDFIHLEYNYGFKWYHSEGISCKGYLFDGNSHYFEGADLIKYFNATTLPQIKEKLVNANGFFSLVIRQDDKIYAAVDRLRSIPLFYSGDRFYLSDDPYWIKNRVAPKMNINSVKEFLIAGYVTGKDTLFNNINQLGAGGLVIYDKLDKSTKVERYFEYDHENYVKKSQEELFDRMHEIHLNMFQRLVVSLSNKMAVIPLSGGYDSRLIIYMLKELGVENVLCFSYGKDNNYEARISKSVANYLGYKWVFIKTERRDWYNYYNSDARKNYFRFASNLSSLSHEQDFIAINRLKEKGMIEDDSVIIPGHSYDFIAGSHIPRYFKNIQNLSYDELINSIFKKHYGLWNWKNTNPELETIFREKIVNLIGYQKQMSGEDASNLFELWDWQERQAKFIVNSIRVYDFFDLEWRLPLWDNEIMNFWLQIPFQHRFERNLFIAYMNTRKNMPTIGVASDQNKLIKLWQKFTNIKYARYTKNPELYSILLSKIKDISNYRQFDFIDENHLVVTKSRNALSALSHIYESNEIFK